jgi:translation initiation factor 2 subunit 2
VLLKFYKGEMLRDFMGYEELLDLAYENVEVSEECNRFEVMKVKGHHEGVRTVISNFGKVATCLRRKPEHLLKFLGKELGIQGEIKGERLILSRKLSSKDVNAKVEKYARRYVICEKCGKPDTEFDGDNGKLFVRCLACGNKNEVHKI